jgi:hypothetical protein
MTFGRRKVPFGAAVAPAPPMPRPPVDSDGKRRVFGEAVFAGPHGDMLRKLGVSIDDPSNVIPEPADFDRMVQDSLQKQEVRRRAYEADLLARFGCNNVRPFFLLGEGVYNTPLGDWLIRVMRLLPYDDWNLIYLPMDRPTRLALDLPYHPQQSIKPVDELMKQRIGALHAQFQEARQKTDAAYARTNDIEVLDLFNRGVDRMRQGIIDFAAATLPNVVEMIADVQREAGTE